MTITGLSFASRNAVVSETGAVYTTSAAAAPYGAEGPLIAGTSNTPNAIDAVLGHTFKINEYNRSFYPGTRLRATAVGETNAWFEGIVTEWDGENVTIDADLSSGAVGTYSNWEINVAGERGQAGPQGPQGLPGTPGGPAGPTGPAGPPGSIWRNGIGAPSNALGVNGDYYLNDSNGDVYLKGSGAYALIANIQGPAGPVGVGVIEEAPIDGSFYSRRNAVWATPPGGGDVQHTRAINSGAGLIGGGDLSADRTLAVGAGTGITVNADDVALTVPVALVNGGTGATTAGAALTNLAAAPLASPALTGTPTSTTPATTDNSTKIATTAYVQAAAITKSGPGLWTHPGGRLTLTTATPVMTSGVLNATTIYYTPYNSNLVPLYTGTDITFQLVSEMSQAISDATKSPAAVIASRVYDLFVWPDAGTIRCTRGPAWSTNTSRGTGAGTSELARVNGLLLNANAITNGPAAQRGTYVGTIATNAAATVDFNFGGAGSGGVSTTLYVWNMYNRALFGPTNTDNGAGYTVGGAGSVTRQCRASPAMAIYFVVGLAENAIQATTNQFITTATTGSGAIGLAQDSIIAFDFYTYFSVGTITGGAPGQQMSCNGIWPSVAGTHYIAALENPEGSNPTFAGAKLAAALWQ